ncbi:hypothetical protein J6X15_01785 [Candidatus Saccharibacteria bacterium]|nr:hypothetical protein [Candidatus Saccharibacteria bacterium]
MNIHCINHKHKMKQAEEIRQNIADETHVIWLFDRMVRFLDQTPSELLTLDANQAGRAFAQAYRRDGLDGGLPHITWLVSSLRSVPANNRTKDILDTAEAVATALQLEW